MALRAHLLRLMLAQTLMTPEAERPRSRNALERHIRVAARTTAGNVRLGRRMSGDGRHDVARRAVRLRRMVILMAGRTV